VQSSEDELLSGLSVTEQTDAASWTLFDDMHQIVLLMEDIEQPVVKHFQKPQYYAVSILFHAQKCYKLSIYYRNKKDNPDFSGFTLLCRHSAMETEVET